MLGDFNQRIPRGGQPQNVYEAMANLLGCGLACATAGLSSDSDLLIDHITVDARLNAKVNKIIPRMSVDGIELSDHVGIICNLRKPTR